MGRRIGIVTVWLAVAAGIVIGLPWLLATSEGGVPLVLEQSAWVVGALVCGLMWLGVEYGRDRRRTFRDRLRQLRKMDQGES